MRQKNILILLSLNFSKSLAVNFLKSIRFISSFVTQPFKKYLDWFNIDNLYLFKPFSSIG